MQNGIFPLHLLEHVVALGFFLALTLLRAVALLQTQNFSLCLVGLAVEIVQQILLTVL